MALRYYRNGPARALAFPIANGTDTSMTVDSAAGFPVQFPYTLIIDPDGALEEVVDVTAAVGNVLTMTRGVDSTTASAHGAGVAVYHGVSARDPREANAHVNATANVHGITGSFVDTDSVQSIPGRKIFDDLETTGGGDVVTLGATQTITGRKVFDDVETTAGGDVVAVGGTQTVTGVKTFDDVRTTAGGAVVAVGGAQTVTGAKTYSGNNVYSGANTFSAANSHSGTETFTGTVSVAGENITGGWTAYAVERHNGTGGGVLATGNGTFVGEYKKIDKIVHFHITLTFGTTTNIGTDDYEFTLPFSMSPFRQAGSAILFDSSLSKHFARTWHGVGSNGVVVIDEAGVRATGAGAGSPMNWATGDVISLSGSYEAP